VAVTDALLDQLRMVESGGNPRAVSPKGALGPYQFMPATAKEFGIDPFNEQQARGAAKKYLSSLVNEFGTEGGLQAYNWGPGNMRAYVKTGYGANGKPMPKETVEYAKKFNVAAGRDLSAELFGDNAPPAGRDLSAELFPNGAPAAEPPKSDLFSMRPGALERGARGVAQGIADVPNALGQIIANGAARLGVPGMDERARSFNQFLAQDDAKYKQDVRGGQDDFDFGRMGGNVVGSLPMTMAAPVGASLTGAAAIGAGTGALSGALQPVTQGNFWDEKGKQVATGAMGGAVFGAGGKALAGMISPNVSAQVALLRKEGVVPTPGQILGGAFKTAEEKLTSVPLLGSAIAGGQRRANEQLNIAAFNRALAPLNDKLPPGMVGRDAVSFVDDKISAAYQNALNNVGPIAIDQPLATSLNATISKLAVLPKDKADQGTRLIQAELFDRAQSGMLTPEAMKSAESNLGRLARQYKTAPDPDQRELGIAMQEAQKALRDAISRQAPPGAAQELKAANTAYANFLRAERAAGSTAAENGVFSPAQLHMAVKNLSPSKKQFSRGTALMEDLSDAGKAVLAQKVPDSGTAGRGMAGAALGGLGVGAATGINPMLAAGLAPALMYTPTGQQLAAALLTGRQGPGFKALADATRRVAVPGGVALTPALQGLLNP
jgi:Transglycosylase SLT domain